jgi:response regulator RpfG family c-di-GMP phosphodiesterase
VQDLDKVPLVSDPDSSTMSIVASVGLPEGEAQDARIRIGEGIAGRVAASQTPLLVKDIDQTNLKSLKPGARYATSSFMISPLMVSYPIRYQRRRIGVINVSDKHSGDPFNEQDLEFLSTLSSQVAVAIENARLVREMEEGYLAALVAMIQAAEDARPETRGHSRNVAGMAVGVARQMALSEARVATLARAAGLHEVGRLVSRPEAERARDGGSDPAAWNAAAVMATERLLAPIASLRVVRDIILQSTAWFDAAPLPYGSATPAIPVEARILSICEDYVRRTGGNGADPARRREALEAIQKHAGRKHDPEVVEALLRVAGGDDAGGGGAR